MKFALSFLFFFEQLHILMFWCLICSIVSGLAYFEDCYFLFRHHFALFFHIPCHSALEFSHLLRGNLQLSFCGYSYWAGISWGLSPLYHSHTDEKTIHKSNNTKLKQIQKHIQSHLKPTSMPTMITEKNRIKQKQTKKPAKIMYSKAYNWWLIISKQK